MNGIEKYEEALNNYLVGMKSNGGSEKTVDLYSRVLKDFGKYLRESGEAGEEVPSTAVVKWKVRRQEEGNSANTLRNKLQIVHGFFHWCIEHKVYAEQPVLVVDVPKKKQVEYDLLTEDEIKRILSGEVPRFCRNTEQTQAIIFLFLLSGLRVSELANVKLSDLNYEDGRIRVVGKGDKLRYTAFPKLAQEYVERYIKEARDKDENSKRTDLLFYSYDKATDKVSPYSRQNLTKIVEVYVKNLTGHKKIGAHDLRHAFASVLLTNKVSIEAIQSLLGHSSYTTTLIYASNLRKGEEPQKANEVLDGIFGNV